MEQPSLGEPAAAPVAAEEVQAVSSQAMVPPPACREEHKEPLPSALPVALAAEDPLGGLQRTFQELLQAADPLPLLDSLRPYFQQAFQGLDPDLPLEERAQYWLSDATLQLFLKTVVPSLLQHLLYRPPPAVAEVPEAGGEPAGSLDSLLAYQGLFLDASRLAALALPFDALQLLHALQQLFGHPTKSMAQRRDRQGLPLFFFDRYGAAPSTRDPDSAEAVRLRKRGFCFLEETPEYRQKISAAEVALAKGVSGRPLLRPWKHVGAPAENPGSCRFSFWSLQCLEEFGDAGGFRGVVARIRAGTPAPGRKAEQRLSLGCFQALLEPLSLGAPAWGRDSMQAWLPELREAVEGYLLGMEHEQLRSQALTDELGCAALLVPLLRRTGAAGGGSRFPHLLGEVGIGTAVPDAGGASLGYAWLQALEQRLWLRDLTTAFTDRRIAALVQLKLRAERLLPPVKDRQQAGGFFGNLWGREDRGGPQGTHRKVWLTPEQVAAFILNCRVIERVLDPQASHPELVRRLPSILRLLLKHPQLKACGDSTVAAWLRGLWGLLLSPGQHASDRELIIDVLGEVVRELVPERLQLLRELYDMVAGSLLEGAEEPKDAAAGASAADVRSAAPRPLLSIDVCVLQLVLYLAQTLLRRGGPTAKLAPSTPGGGPEILGVELFWRLIRDHIVASRGGAPPSRLTKAGLDEAVSCFLGLLKTPEGRGVRYHYLRRCMADLRSAAAIPAPRGSAVPPQATPPVLPAAAEGDEGGAADEASAVSSGTSLQLVRLILQTYTAPASGAGGGGGSGGIAGWFGGRRSPGPPASPAGVLAGGSEPDPLTLPEVIDRLEADYQLVGFVLDELRAASAADDGAAVPERIRRSPAALRSWMAVRQRFLVFVLTNSRLQLTEPQIARLWDALVLPGAAASPETDDFFEWLAPFASWYPAAPPSSSTNSPQAPRGLFSPAAQAFLFERRILASLPPETVSASGFRLFQQYLVAVNLQRGAVGYSGGPAGAGDGGSLADPEKEFRRRESLLRERLEIRMPDRLVGLDFLRRCAVSHPDEAVGDRAVDLLTLFQTRLAPSPVDGSAAENEAAVSAFVQAHTAFCLDSIAADDPGVERKDDRPLDDDPGAPRAGPSLQTRRALRLLQSFLCAAGAGSHAGGAESDLLEIQVRPVASLRVPEFSLRVPRSSETLQRLQTRIGLVLRRLNPDLAGGPGPLEFSLGKESLLAAHRHQPETLVGESELLAGGHPVIVGRRLNPSSSLAAARQLWDRSRPDLPPLPPPEARGQVQLQPAKRLSLDRVAEYFPGWDEQALRLEPDGRPQPATQKTPLPMQLLARDGTAFRRLMTLLEHPATPSELARRIWRVLLLMPVSQDLLAQVLRREAEQAATAPGSPRVPRFEALFDPARPHRLLYSLQCLHSVLAGRIPLGQGLLAQLASWRGPPRAIPPPGAGPPPADRRAPQVPPGSDDSHPRAWAGWVAEFLNDGGILGLFELVQQLADLLLPASDARPRRPTDPRPQDRAVLLESLGLAWACLHEVLCWDPEYAGGKLDESLVPAAAGSPAGFRRRAPGMVIRATPGFPDLARQAIHRALLPVLASVDSVAAGPGDCHPDEDILEQTEALRRRRLQPREDRVIRWLRSGRPLPRSRLSLAEEESAPRGAADQAEIVSPLEPDADAAGAAAPGLAVAHGGRLLCGLLQTLLDAAEASGDPRAAAQAEAELLGADPALPGSDGDSLRLLWCGALQQILLGPAPPALTIRLAQQLQVVLLSPLANQRGSRAEFLLRCLLWVLRRNTPPAGGWDPGPAAGAPGLPVDWSASLAFFLLLSASLKAAFLAEVGRLAGRAAVLQAAANWRPAEELGGPGSANPLLLPLGVAGNTVRALHAECLSAVWALLGSLRPPAVDPGQARALAAARRGLHTVAPRLSELQADDECVLGCLDVLREVVECREVLTHNADLVIGALGYLEKRHRNQADPAEAAHRPCPPLPRPGELLEFLYARCLFALPPPEPPAAAAAASLRSSQCVDGALCGGPEARLQAYRLVFDLLQSAALTDTIRQRLGSQPLVALLDGQGTDPDSAAVSCQDLLLWLLRWTAAHPIWARSDSRNLAAGPRPAPEGDPEAKLDAGTAAASDPEEKGADQQQEEQQQEQREPLRRVPPAEQGHAHLREVFPWLEGSGPRRGDSSEAGTPRSGLAVLPWNHEPFQEAKPVFNPALRGVSGCTLAVSAPGEDSAQALTLFPGGMSGLVNQGSTCYMNSLLQQLFMLPGFRSEVLRIGEGRAERDSPDSPGGGDGRAVLRELQQLFGHLLLAERRSYDTRPFCDSLQLANLNEQQDVNEFAMQLFDKLDAQVRGTSHSQLVNETFRGRISHQIISQDCPHVSERPEDFFMLSLTVQNKASVRESLDAYVAGELLDGDNRYRCEQCFQARVQAEGELLRQLRELEQRLQPPKPGPEQSALGAEAAEGAAEPSDEEELRAQYQQVRAELQALQQDDRNQWGKVAARKVACLAAPLPPVLLLHLKRFEFDFETLRKVKINDSYSFPRQLDLREWTREHLARQGRLAPGGGGGDVNDNDERRGASGASSEDPATPADPSAPGVASAPAEDCAPTAYDLVGVLVHTGGADAGHYYSYVRGQGPAGCGSQQQLEQWFEFNDHQVYPFDVGTLAQNCFGGEYEKQVWDRDAGCWVTKTFSRPASAYMLVYQRQQPQAARAGTGPVAAAAAAAAAAEIPPAEAPVHPKESLAAVPESVLRQVYQSNWNQRLELQAFSEGFQEQWVGGLLRLAEEDAQRQQQQPQREGGREQQSAARRDDEGARLALCELDARRISIAVQLLFQLLAHGVQTERFGEWMERCRRLLQQSGSARLWLIQEAVRRPLWLRTQLLDCPTPEFRLAFAELLRFAVQEWLRAYTADGADEVAAGSRVGGGHPWSTEALLREALRGPAPPFAGKVRRRRQLGPDSPITVLMEALLGWLPELRYHPRAYSEFFWLLRGLAALGPEVRELMVRLGTIGRLANFYASPEPVPGFNRPPQRWGASASGSASAGAEERHRAPPAGKWLLSTVAVLVRSCLPPALEHNPDCGPSPLQLDGRGQRSLAAAQPAPAGATLRLPQALPEAELLALLQGVVPGPGLLRELLVGAGWDPSQAERCRAHSLGMLPLMLGGGNSAPELALEIGDIARHLSWGCPGLAQGFMALAQDGLRLQLVGARVPQELNLAPAVAADLPETSSRPPPAHPKLLSQEPDSRFQPYLTLWASVVSVPDTHRRMRTETGVAGLMDTLRRLLTESERLLNGHFGESRLVFFILKQLLTLASEDPLVYEALRPHLSDFGSWMNDFARNFRLV